ncbi:FAD-dependent oxidoreductase [Bradyrhizobium sp. HKCCYLS2038]|uniref:FAD-dependent oxidoreductase n=1 Tax=unclassified Bradyrhizobium TaxID=2631580 RepID=UPI003EBEEEB5
MTRPRVDFLVIGGGFYGCSLALLLRSISENITIVEAGDRLMDRASRVNQARVHTGFHYPRSALTAVKSMVLHQRFARDFPDAVVDSFQMLYGIAQRRSKVSAKRFYRMFSDMGAPIAPADPSRAALFDPHTIEAVFDCVEYAFDSTVLRAGMAERIAAAGIELRLQTEVIRLEERPDEVVAELANGTSISARHVFNVTYSQINALLKTAGLAPTEVKHELAEVALVRPPAQLAPYGFTVMDGPFFSMMPYPAEQLHSLTHVRYTPHVSWTDATAGRSAYDVFRGLEKTSRNRHMILDGARYLPALAETEWVKSLYEIKTVLLRNERDDGRPILYQRHPADSRIITIMGGKIDNIYDLFDLIRMSRPEWAGVNEAYVHGEAQRRLGAAE